MSALDFRWISRNSMMVWWTAHPWKADWEEGKEGLHLSSVLTGLWVSESPTRIFWCYKSSRWGMYFISYHIRDTQMVKNSHTLSPKLHFFTLEKKNALCAVLLPLNIGQQPFMNIIVIRHNLLTYELPMSSIQQPDGKFCRDDKLRTQFSPSHPTYKIVEIIDSWTLVEPQSILNQC